MSLKPACTPHPYNGFDGTMPRAVFEATYEPVPLTRNRRAERRRRADVLMESLDGDASQVMLYPANASVAEYPWRSYWRLKEERA